MLTDEPFALWRRGSAGVSARAAGLIGARPRRAGSRSCGWQRRRRVRPSRARKTPRSPRQGPPARLGSSNGSPASTRRKPTARIIRSIEAAQLPPLPLVDPVELRERSTAGEPEANDRVGDDRAAPADPMNPRKRPHRIPEVREKIAAIDQVRRCRGQCQVHRPTAVAASRLNPGPGGPVRTGRTWSRRSRARPGVPDRPGGQSSSSGSARSTATTSAAPRRSSSNAQKPSIVPTSRHRSPSSDSGSR